MFREHGFHASGVQSIVDHAGIPKGSFYNHFKSKDALGLEVLNHYWDQYAEAHVGLKDKELPALERIDRHLAAFRHDEFGCLIGNFSGELANTDAFRARLSGFYEQWISDLAACINEGQQDGTVRKDETDKHLAEFVIVSLQGAVLKNKVDRDPAILERTRKSILRYLKSN